MNDIWHEDVSRKSEQEQFRNDQSRNSKFLYMILCFIWFVHHNRYWNEGSMITIRMG